MIVDHYPGSYCISYTFAELLRKYKILIISPESPRVKLVIISFKITFRYNTICFVYVTGHVANLQELYILLGFYITERNREIYLQY